MALPDDEKLRQLDDPQRREEWNRLAQSEVGLNRSWANWGNYRLLETSATNSSYSGRMVGEVASELGMSAWEALAGIVRTDALRTVFAKDDPGVDDATWQLRVEKWRDPRTIVGGSDSGAHLDMIDSFSFSTTLLGRAMRELRLLPVEEAVHYLTGAPAAVRTRRPRVPHPSRVGRHRRVRSGSDRPRSGRDALRPPRRGGPPVWRGDGHRARLRRRDRSRHRQRLHRRHPGAELRSGYDTRAVTAR